VHCGVLTIGARKKLGLLSRFDFKLGDPLQGLRDAQVGWMRLPAQRVHDHHVQILQ